MVSPYKEEIVPPTLFKVDDLNRWKEEWENMPEFIQGKQKPYAQIIFRFATKEDLDAFSALIKQKLNKKTKSAWYPQIMRGFDANKRWIDES